MRARADSAVSASSRRWRKAAAPGKTRRRRWRGSEEQLERMSAEQRVPAAVDADESDETWRRWTSQKLRRTSTTQRRAAWTAARGATADQRGDQRAGELADEQQQLGAVARRRRRRRRTRGGTADPDETRQQRTSRRGFDETRRRDGLLAKKTNL
ncbi:hypothetical protein Syun_010449 [Stephania yunnanensis]|uniref:Uncharacterized protein n=1 Tax=Stephania yunnanensis TaxID=152371 RepID=A0AAP0PRS3_9MAGN